MEPVYHLLVYREAVVLQINHRIFGNYCCSYFLCLTSRQFKMAASEYEKYTIYPTLLFVYFIFIHEKFNYGLTRSICSGIFLAADMKFWKLSFQTNLLEIWVNVLHKLMECFLKNEFAPQTLFFWTEKLRDLLPKTRETDCMPGVCTTAPHHDIPPLTPCTIPTVRWDNITQLFLSYKQRRKMECIIQTNCPYPGLKTDWIRFFFNTFQLYRRN